MSDLPPVVSMREVVALIGNYPVLAGATLSVESGEVVLLEGPNGAGKTSVLRACAGLLPIHRGELRVLGIDLVIYRDLLRGVGFLGHQNGLYAELTAEENLKFYARAIRVPEASIKIALEHMRLSTRIANTRVSKLSAGQRRRVAIAVLLLSDAKLWLLDEPHAGLDSNSRNIIDAAINVSAANGKTILFASHERERARSVATRIVSIDGGCVQRDVPNLIAKEPETVNVG
jgi:heme ABC exporter ATP-binding subunit CcmA